jgi:hypothetical protein
MHVSLSVRRHVKDGRPLTPSRPHAGPDGRIPGIMEDQLPDLIADVLPVMDEVACLLSTHHFSAFFFKNRENRGSIDVLAGGLLSSDSSKGRGHTIKLGVGPAPDPAGPLYLAGGTNQFDSVDLRRRTTCAAFVLPAFDASRDLRIAS